jgi:plastocyanin
VSLLNSKTVKNPTRISLFIIASFAQVTVRAWDVDMSRRQKDLKSLRMPASITDQAQKPNSTLTNFFEAVEPTQEIVIMNTEKGFVPETLRLKKGGNYKIFVVNVNDKEKNVSFIMDAFSEHHATYFGEQKSFTVTPKADGIFSFQCPETASQGRVIVFDDKDNRKPASE